MRPVVTSSPTKRRSPVSLPRTLSRSPSSLKSLTLKSPASTLSSKSPEQVKRHLDLSEMKDILQTLQPGEFLDATFNDQFKNGSVELRFSCAHAGRPPKPVVTIDLMGNGNGTRKSFNKNPIIGRDAECISFKFHREKHQIELDSYYYYQGCSPLPITHEDFFNKLLKPISNALGARIKLDDASETPMKQCPSVPNLVFYFAKGISFYQRFQFKNEQYTALLDKLREMTVEQAFGERFKSSAEMTKRMYKEDPEGIRPLMSEYLKLRILLKTLGMVRSKIKDIADYILKNCKGEEKFLRKKHTLRGRLRLIKGDNHVFELSDLLQTVFIDFADHNYDGQYYWYYTPPKSPDSTLL